VQNEFKTHVFGRKRAHFVESVEQERLDKVPRITPASTARAVNPRDDYFLARKVGMCFGCGQLYTAAVGTGDRYDKTANDPVCARPFVRGVKTDEFKAAIVQWRNLADSGKSWNAIAKLAD
jgi:hypothetical protein